MDPLLPFPLPVLCCPILEVFRSKIGEEQKYQVKKEKALSMHGPSSAASGHPGPQWRREEAAPLRQEHRAAYFNS